MNKATQHLEVYLRACGSGEEEPVAVTLAILRDDFEKNKALPNMRQITHQILDAIIAEYMVDHPYSFMANHNLINLMQWHATKVNEPSVREKNSRRDLSGAVWE